MTSPRFFTDAASLREPSGGGLLEEMVPTGVRNAVANYLEPRYEDELGAMWKAAVVDLDWDPALARGGNQGPVGSMFKTLSTIGYAGCLDLFSAFYYFAERRKSPFPANSFRNLLNERLIRHYSAYQMDETGLMRTVGGEPAEEALADARALLRDERFAGPDRQFQEAVIAFHRRPDPNYETAISNAINAVEGTARILLKDPKILLRKAMMRVKTEHDLHGALVDSITDMYGYASDAAGRHGLVGDPDADRSIAEFCLHQCASSIVFLARLYDAEVTEGPVTR